MFFCQASVLWLWAKGQEQHSCPREHLPCQDQKLKANVLSQEREHPKTLLPSLFHSCQTSQLSPLPQQQNKKCFHIVVSWETATKIYTHQFQSRNGLVAACTGHVHTSDNRMKSQLENNLLQIIHVLLNGYRQQYYIEHFKLKNDLQSVIWEM